MGTCQVTISLILMRIIDVSQSVVRDHIIANELLERDIKNISFEFSKMGVDTSIEDLTNRLIKD